MRRSLLLSAVVAAFAAYSPAADPDATEPFNGKDLTGWKLKNDKKKPWSVGCFVMNPEKPGALAERRRTSTDILELVNPVGGGSDISTEKKFGDGIYEVEFMIPRGSNSGIYVMGEYEVQILDSYGKANDKLGMGDLGALYSAAAPKVNAAKKPGEWQKFIIDFRAPRFEGDKKVANATFVKVTLNGTVLHENVQMKGPTPGGLTGKEAATGPLMFQGDHGPVAFRSIKITSK